MSDIFLRILNLSITASWLILAIVIIRPLIKKAPKWLNCALWALAAIRLVCPFSFESVLSLVPSSEPIPHDIALERNPAINSGIPALNQVVNPVIAKRFTPDPVASANPLQIVIWVSAIIWMAGMIALLLYALIGYMNLRRTVGASIPLENDILACDEVKSPFILGIFNPLIYVPSSMSGETLKYVITHEKAHLKRYDHLWKPLGYILLTIYWFNPLSWIAYILLCRDIEMACDEKVIRDMDHNEKVAYSQALFDCSFPRKKMVACPLAFGEVGVKERVKSVLHYKKSAFWIIIAAIISIIILAVLFLTNPKNDTYEITFHIPAGCENELVFSEEEISPLKKKVFFEVGQDVGDNEIRLMDEDGNSNLCVYVTPGINSDIEMKQGVWYKVGIYGRNDTEEEKILRVTVKNVEARIAANKNTVVESKETIVGTESLKDMIEVRMPNIDLSASTGADGSTIYYADENIFIFGGCYGLFVYDVKTNQIIRSVDLASIGCNFTQGDDACEIFATADGSKVLLSPISSNMMYVFSVADNQMWREPFDFDSYDLYKAQYTEENEYGKRAQYEKNGAIRYYCLVNDITIGELGYTIDIQSSYHTIFGANGPNELNPNEAVDFLPSDIHSLQEVDVVLAHSEVHKVVDKDILKQLEAMLSQAEEIKGIDCPHNISLYLYREDGSVGIIYLATDSCDVFYSGGKYYDFGAGDNEELWHILGFEVDF